MDLLYARRVCFVNPRLLDQILSHSLRASLIANPALFASSLAAMQQSEAYDGVLRTLASQCAQLEGREKASVLASCAQYLGWLNSPAVRAAIRDSSFDPLWLKTGNADLFISMPAERVRSASGFCRFILSGLLRRLADGPPDESLPVLVVLDEAALFGSLPVLEDAVTLLAGWGLKFIFVWQSLGQITECFPDGKAQTFLANMSVQVFGKTQEIETAKHVSERCGDTTVLATSVQSGGSSSHSGGADPRQSSSQQSTSWSVTHNEAGRRLIRTEDVLGLPAELMIVFTDRTPPLLVRQVRYYEPEFVPKPKVARVWWLVLGLTLLLAAFFAAFDRPAPRATNTPDRDHGRPGGKVFPLPVRRE